MLMQTQENDWAKASMSNLHTGLNELRPKFGLSYFKYVQLNASNSNSGIHKFLITKKSTAVTTPIT